MPMRSARVGDEAASGTVLDGEPDGGLDGVLASASGIDGSVDRRLVTDAEASVQHGDFERT